MVAASIKECLKYGHRVQSIVDRCLIGQGRGTLTAAGELESHDAADWRFREQLDKPTRDEPTTIREG